MECAQWTCGFVSMRQVHFQLLGAVSVHTAFDKLDRQAPVCSGGESEISQIEEIEERQMSGVAERRRENVRR